MCYSQSDAEQPLELHEIGGHLKIFILLLGPYQAITIMLNFSIPGETQIEKNESF